MFESRVLKPGRNEEVWVKSCGKDEFELGVQYTPDQYTYLTVTRAQLEEHVTNIHAALLETSY